MKELTSQEISLISGAGGAECSNQIVTAGAFGAAIGAATGGGIGLIGGPAGAAFGAYIGTMVGAGLGGAWGSTGGFCRGKSLPQIRPNNIVIRP